MTTKQVLSLCAMFLGKEELLSCSYFTGTNEEISSENQKELEILNRCLNLVISEIATDYLPIQKEKEIRFNASKCQLKDIDENIYQVVKVIDKTKQPIKFKIYGDTLIADTSIANIHYTSFAEKCELTGNVETFSSLVSDRVLAYGTAMEYSFISSLFDDAQIWESRYKNALMVISSKKKNIVMPKRRWL